MKRKKPASLLSISSIKIEVASGHSLAIIDDRVVGIFIAVLVVVFFVFPFTYVPWLEGASPGTGFLRALILFLQRFEYDVRT